MRFLLVDRRAGLKRGIDNPPRFLDIVFASEQRPIASYGVSEDAFVGGHLAGIGVTARQHLNRLRSWFIGLRHGRRTQRDSYVGTDAKTEMIRRQLDFANH